MDSRTPLLVRDRVVQYSSLGLDYFRVLILTVSKSGNAYQGIPAELHVR